MVTRSVRVPACSAGATPSEAFGRVGRATVKAKMPSDNFLAASGVANPTGAYDHDLLVAKRAIRAFCRVRAIVLEE